MITNGRQSRDECEAQVKGFPKAAYKKFPTRVAAEDYMGGSRAVTSTAQPATTLIKDDTSSSMTTKPLSDLSPTAISAQSSGYTVTPDSHLVVWTDGSAVGNGKVGSVGGLGVYWGRAGNAAQRNLAEALPGPVQTNNRAELLAIIRALETNPYPDLPLEIRTDSKYSISCLTIYLPSWLRNNFRTATGEPVKNQDMIVHLIALLNRRGRGLQGNGLVRFKHVRAHVGIQGNEEADRLANVGSAMPRVPERTNWLSLMDAENEAVAYKTRRGKTLSSVEPVDVEVEVDPSWLLDETEMQELDRTQAF